MKHSNNQLTGWVTMAIAALAIVIPLSIVPLGGETAGWQEESSQRAEPESSSSPAQPETKSPEGESSEEEVLEGFQHILVGQEQLYSGNLILVNNTQPYHFPDTDAIQPVLEHKNQSYRVKDSLVSLQEHVIGPLNALFAAYDREGRENDLLLISGYRSQEHQQAILDSRVEQEGEQEARNWVAVPGGSEHHTGLALDLSLYDPATGIGRDYTGEGDYAWINTHCPEYGFIIRYPQGKQEQTGIDYEPWHLRYVGPEHAMAMAEHGLCLEEYIDFLRGYPFDGEHLQVETLKGEYEIYFVPADGEQTQLPVPESRAYTLSGNNVDGFVVAAALAPDAMGGQA